MNRREFINRVLLFTAITPFLTKCYYKNIYEANRINKTRKYLVIGSGISGLCTAAILSKLGNNVVVLEKNPNYLGGHARTIEINDMKFSAGPQYVWNFSPNNFGIGQKILRFLDIEKSVPFIGMDTDIFEKFFLGEKEEYSIPMGLDNFRAHAKKYFPYEINKIDDFFELVETTFEGARFLHDEGLYLEGITDMISNILFTSKLSLSTKLKLAQIYDKSLDDIFNKFNLSPKLRRYLYAHGGIFAENSENISFGVYVAATGYFHLGSSIPQYGFESLIGALSDVVTNNGGKVYTNKYVDRIEVEGKSITKVICKDQSIYQADEYISSISPRLICNKLSQCDEKIMNYVPSNSLTSCFVGLDYYSELDDLRLRNYWWQSYPQQPDYNNPDMLNPPLMFYVNSHTISGVKNNNKNNLQGITIFAPGNFIQSKEYFSKGIEGYEEFKKNIGEVILNKVEQIALPNLTKHIKFVETYTPYDIFLELGAENGNVYGRRAHYMNVLKRVKRFDNISNIHFTCATIGQPGVASGFQTANIIVSHLLGFSI